MLVDENGDLVLVNVSSVYSGHYQCQSNVSGTIIDGSSYQLTVQNSTGNIDGKVLQSCCIYMLYGVPMCFMFTLCSYFSFL